MTTVPVSAQCLLMSALGPTDAHAFRGHMPTTRGYLEIEERKQNVSRQKKTVTAVLPYLLVSVLKDGGQPRQQLRDRWLHLAHTDHVHDCLVLSLPQCRETSNNRVGGAKSR